MGVSNGLHFHNLAAGDKLFKEVLNAAKSALKHLFAMGSYSPEDLKKKEYRKLIDETYKVFERAIADNDIPDRMRQALESDAFLFGGLKAHAQLSEAFSMIKDGHIKSWSEIEHEFDKLNDTYNRYWLQAEYNFAVNASQQAANWANTDPDGRYNLQYRTALDEKVREEHAALEGITLPKEDEFWSKFYPPNGWNCRCTAVEVRKSKYAESDAEEAMKKGEAATSQIGKDGKNRLEIFRFNPGQEEKLFPPEHPYQPRGCNGKPNTLQGMPVIVLSADDDKCKAKNEIDKIWKEKRKKKQKTIREEHLRSMQPLLKKNMIRYVGNNLHIKIGFSKKGNKHIVDDFLNRTSGLSKKDLTKLHSTLKGAEFIRSSELYKDRSDNIQKFYYFKDKEKDLYYNVAETERKLRNGKVLLDRFLYSITNDMPIKK